MKKKVLIALTVSLLAMSALSLSFAKKGSANTAPPVTTNGYSAWSD